MAGGAGSSASSATAAHGPGRSPGPGRGGAGTRTAAGAPAPPSAAHGKRAGPRGKPRPVQWSCRTGVCHTCETAVVSGRVDYSPDPID
ncbi:2Fe-2S iron-sulfur cluster-binding protein, partial [Streptomyces sp. NPDC005071]